MLVLCAWALLLLGVTAFVRPTASTRAILSYADNVICALFLADFLNSLFRADDKWRYLRTWGWVDLLSRIPTIDALRLGRAARVMRILRSARAMAQFLVGRRTESAFLASVLLALLLVVCCSIAVLEFEVPAGGNIASGEDAMWWAVTTMTTVGYGDRFPVTSEGRLVAVLLMASGVGLFGTLSGLAASWFLTPASAEANDANLAEIKELLQELKQRRSPP